MSRISDEHLVPFLYVFVRFSDSAVEDGQLGALIAPPDTDVDGAHSSFTEGRATGFHPDMVVDTELSEMLTGDTDVEGATDKGPEHELPPRVTIDLEKGEIDRHGIDVREGRAPLSDWRKRVEARLPNEHSDARADASLAAQLRKFGDKFDIDRIVGVDVPVKISSGSGDIQDRMELHHKRYVGLRWETESEDLSESRNSRLPIYERFSIVLGELGSYNVFPVVIDDPDDEPRLGEPEEDSCEIRLSRERPVSQRYLRPLRHWNCAKNLDFGGGLFEGRIHIGADEKRIPILIHPHKVSPIQAEAVVDDLLETTEATGDAASAVALDVGDAIDKSPLQALLQLERIFRDDPHGSVPLRQSLRVIRQRPDKELRTRTVDRKPHDIRNPSPDAMSRALTDGDVRPLDDTTSGDGHFSYPESEDEVFRLTQVRDREPEITYDTYPNQFVRFFLDRAREIVQKGLSALERADHVDRESAWVRSIEQRARRILRRDIAPMLREDWMENVSELRQLAPPPRKLVQDEYYADVFLNYRDLVRSFTFDADLEEYLLSPVTYMPELYERWCLLQLQEACSDQFKVAHEKKYKNDSPAEWGTYTIDLKPDFSVVPNDRNDTPLVLFDAKYRLNWKPSNEEDTEELEQEERRGTWKAGDLHKMHTYREAIRRNGEPPKWVIILYPGGDPRFYSMDGKDSTSPTGSGGVGALPLIPNSDSSGEPEESGGQLREVLESVFER